MQSPLRACAEPRRLFAASHLLRSLGTQLQRADNGTALERVENRTARTAQVVLHNTTTLELFNLNMILPSKGAECTRCIPPGARRIRPALGRSILHSRFVQSRTLLLQHSSKTMRLSLHSTSVERLYQLRPELETALKEASGSCLTSTNLYFGKRTVGKVRDTYDLGDKLLVVTTDRQSAFDRLLAAIPFKGQVLNETSAWWMEQTQHIVPNALLAVPDSNATLMHKCTVLPVEVVVRGYLTGSTETSLWTHYKDGERNYCGNVLPDGMRKNERLQHNIITPTTKAADGDVPISPQDIVAQGLLSQLQWDQVSQAALQLFAFGQEQAARRGLLLVDTKYEFGSKEDGSIILIDEIHTPDSSRYWLAETYTDRLAQGKEPHNIDKEFLRLWFRQHCDPYHDEVLPEAPWELVAELSRRYITLYEKITGQQFQPATAGSSVEERIACNVNAALAKL